MANVAILGEMRGGNRFPRGAYHLVERFAGVKVGVELAAKFAGAARARVETLQCSWINVFHKRASWLTDAVAGEHKIACI